MHEIRVYEPSFAESYRSLLSVAKGATLNHSLEYKSFLEQIIPEATSHYLCLWRDSILDAVMPAMALENGGKIVYNSLPFFGSHGGVLLRKPDDFRGEEVLLNAFTALARSEDVLAATVVESVFRESTMLPKSFPYNYSDDRIGQVTSLPHEAPGADLDEVLLAMFHKDTRNAARKAAKSGLLFASESSQGALRSVFGIHAENMATIGGRPKPAGFPEAVGKNFKYGEDYKVYVAKSHNKIIAGLVVFYFQDTVEYFMPAIKAQYRSSQAISGLIMLAMREAIQERRSRLWNWGGTWRNQEGVHNFKRKWAATDIPYRYYSLLNPSVEWDVPNSVALASRFPNFYIAPFPSLSTNA